VAVFLLPTMQFSTSAYPLVDDEIPGRGTESPAIPPAGRLDGGRQRRAHRSGDVALNLSAHDHRGATVREVLERLARIESALKTLVERQTVKDFYSTDELAVIFGKAEFTVREWCRKGRIKAQKRRSGRGKFQSWVVSHEELQRIQREGLLPED
jgi:hypothetical protein